MVRAGLAGDRAGLDPESLLQTALGDDSSIVSYPGPDGWASASGTTPVGRPDQVYIFRGPRIVARVGFDTSRQDELPVIRVGEMPAGEFDNTRLRADLRRHLAELAQSRSRIADAHRTERRRIERDLHDGAQQRPPALAFDLQSAQLNGDQQRMRAALAHGATAAQLAVRELRDLANGLHPQALVDGGLRAVLDDLPRRSIVAMSITCPSDRYSKGSSRPRLATWVTRGRRPSY